MSFQKAIQAAKSVLLAKQSYMSTYASGSLVVDHLFDSFGGLDVAIPLGTIISAKADDIDTIGIDSGDLRSNSTGGDDGLFPSGGVLRKRRFAAAGTGSEISNGAGFDGLCDLLFELCEQFLESHVWLLSIN